MTHYCKTYGRNKIHFSSSASCAQLPCFLATIVAFTQPMNMKDLNLVEQLFLDFYYGLLTNSDTIYCTLFNYNYGLIVEKFRKIITTFLTLN